MDKYIVKRPRVESTVVEVRDRTLKKLQPLQFFSCIRFGRSAALLVR